MVLNNVVLEIGTEEIPSRFLKDMIGPFERFAREDMEAARIPFQNLSVYATPRRLALLLRGVGEKQSDLVSTFKGPAWRTAFDVNGQPTRAAEGFAKSRGVSIEQLVAMDVDGVQYAAASVSEPGKRTMDVLPTLFPELIRKIVFPKNMYWNDPTIRFARPIRWLLAMADSEVVPFTYGGLESGNETSGHRFMGAKRIAVDDAGRFIELLYDNYVILDQEKRRQKMISGIAALEKQLEGTVELDPELVDENLFLVEYPVPFTGAFSERYLDIPEQVLTTSMKKNQKYFAVRSKGGKLLPAFVGVSNNLASNMDVVREGNERVLRARLEDAAFFWAEDLRTPLCANGEKLKSIVYQEKLGSLYEKVMCTKDLALWLCAEMDMKDIAPLVDRAALLSKMDLVTNMVYEFPELQGIMGREYALRNGEDERVAQALYEQYLPRSAGDALPSDVVGALLGIAERMHIIVSCHKVGLEPTGSQDPYALRRAARCINEIIWGKAMDVDVSRLVDESCRQLAIEDGIRDRVLQFLSQRLLMQVKEKDYSHELAALALSVTGRRPLQVVRFLEVFSQLQGQKWFADLLTSAVRVHNILAKERETVCGDIDEALLEKDAERALLNEMTAMTPRVEDAVSRANWSELARSLAELTPFITKFFDDVLVVDPDERKKANRISLLSLCNGLFLKVGDLGMLKGV